TSSVGISATPGPLQMDRAGHASTAHPVRRVTSLVRPLEDAELFAAKLEHLGHEGELLQLPVPVQGPQDLLLGPDLDEVAASQFRIACHMWCRTSSSSCLQGNACQFPKPTLTCPHSGSRPQTRAAENLLPAPNPIVPQE